MGRGLAPESAAIDARDLHRFFDDKIAAVRAATADASPPTFTPAPAGCSLSTFRILTITDVTTAICHLYDKQCASDPLPTRLLKDNIDLLAPFITTLFNTRRGRSRRRAFRSNIYRRRSPSPRQF